MRHDNDSFEKKLAAYIAVASAVLAIPKQTDAQIIYNDVNPDAVLNGLVGWGSYQLDLNNDGIVDFRLKTIAFSDSSSGSQHFSASLSSTNKIQAYGFNMVLASSLGNFPKPLSLGDIIDSNNVFLQNGILEHRYSTQSFSSGWGTPVSNTFYSESGLFDFAIEKYIGLKLSMGGNTYYGWARVRLDWGHLTVYDYAVNSIPNQQILAGQQ